MPVVLSEEEIERIMQQPDIGAPYGLRDRTILETFSGTGIRRTELCRLRINDIAVDRRTLFLKEGGKDWLRPIGPRAVSWIRRFLNDVRQALLLDVNDQTLMSI